jgi:hypothetical protein
MDNQSFTNLIMSGLDGQATTPHGTLPLNGGNRKRHPTSEPSATGEQEYQFPPGAYDPLAALVMTRFYDAQRVRTSTKLGNTPLDQVLRQCWEQYHGVQDCKTAELVESTGVDLNLNLTQLKAGALQAWMRDILLGSLDFPWTINASPTPTLSAGAKQSVLYALKVELFQKGYDGDITALVRQLRDHKMTMEQDRASTAARAMENLMHDQAVEGDFRRTFLAFLQDFSIYPYAVLHGPLFVKEPGFMWSGDQQGEKLMTKWVGKRISPFDLFWSSDSPDTQRGTYICLRERMTKAQLWNARDMKGWIGKNVEAAINHFSNTARDWLSPNPERTQATLTWAPYESILVIKHYGVVSSRTLSQYGLALDEGFYETEVVTLGHYTLRARVLGRRHAYARPVHTTSFEKGIDQIPGFSIPQKVRDIERAYHASLRALIRNAHYSSGPIGEVDYSRVQRFIDEEDIGAVEPYTVMPVDPDQTGGGRPAHSFHNVTNVSAALVNLMNHFEAKADRFTQIPASIHGEPVGTGANRTFRGVTFLYSNAMKGLQSALANIDSDVITPYATNQAHLNMEYEAKNFPAILEGDIHVVARGSTGMLQREIEKQQSVESLNLVAQLASSGQVKPEIVNWAARQALTRAGVPMDMLDPVGSDQNPLPDVSGTAKTASSGTPSSIGFGANSLGGLPPSPAR